MASLAAFAAGGHASGLLEAISFESSAVGKATALARSRQAVCATAARPPTMDGRLDDACWAQATPAGSFVLTGSGGAPAEATEAKLVCDARALYVGFVCHDSAMAKLVAPERPHDYPMWNDDVVEVLLDPNGQRTDDYHFILSAAGAQYEGHERLITDLRGGHMVEGPEWNGAWQGAVYRGADFWSAEIAIPFATLGLREAPGPAGWPLDLMREEQPHGEVSIWSGLHGGFGQMQDWGYVLLGDPGVLLGRVLVDRPGWGENAATVVLESTGAAREVLVEASVRGEPAAEAHPAVRASVPAGQVRSVAIPFTIGGPSGEYVLDVSCVSPDRKRTFGTRAVALRTPPLLEFALSQRLIYVSEETLVGTVQIGAAGRALEGLRLAITVRTPEGKTLAARPVACRGRQAEVVLRVPRGPAGDYRVRIALTDGRGKPLATQEARVERLVGPFD